MPRYKITKIDMYECSKIGCAYCKYNQPNKNMVYKTCKILTETMAQSDLENKIYNSIIKYFTPINNTTIKELAEMIGPAVKELSNKICEDILPK